jgi:hypothetical protein
MVESALKIVSDEAGITAGSRVIEGRKGSFYTYLYFGRGPDAYLARR